MSHHSYSRPSAGLHRVAGGALQRAHGAGDQVDPGDGLQEGAQGEVRARRLRVRPGRARVLRQGRDHHSGGTQKDESQAQWHLQSQASSSSSQQIPEEKCDLEPQRTCKHVTTLVPKLQPSEECVDVPKEVRTKHNCFPTKLVYRVCCHLFFARSAPGAR